MYRLVPSLAVSVIGLAQPIGHGAGSAAAFTRRSGGWLHTEQYQHASYGGVTSHHMGLPHMGQRPIGPTAWLLVMRGMLPQRPGPGAGLRPGLTRVRVAVHAR
ncbi:hypothetical protein ACFP1Z_16655 [Streptomyces gamaensis]|uniref:Secreted protein n=1 Tax=Streptomyces gamaensis TaxID=1763542 RepID=A0ABW0Z2V9_9ACTN